MMSTNIITFNFYRLGLPLWFNIFDKIQTRENVLVIHEKQLHRVHTKNPKVRLSNYAIAK